MDRVKSGGAVLTIGVCNLVRAYICLPSSPGTPGRIEGGGIEGVTQTIQAKFALRVGPPALPGVLEDYARERVNLLRPGVSSSP